MDLPDFFGIDIGDHSIKVAQVKRKGADKAELQKLGAVITNVGLLEDESDQGTENLAKSLKEAKQAADISTNNCVAAIPESPLFSRLLSIPKVDDDKIEETVHWELKPLIPVPLDDVDIAFLEIGETVQNGQTMLDIYAVASPKKIVERYKQVCALAGLNLIAVETESLSNTRTVSFNYGLQKSAMIVDFGSHNTDVVLARDGVPIFAQTISTGSDSLTKAIAADYGITEQQAEQYKKAYGMRFDQGEGKIAKSIEPIMQLIISEMSRTLTYLKQRVGESQTAKMFMVGEAAKLPGLPDYLKQQLGLETLLVDPIAKLELSGGLKSKLEQANTLGYSVAIGLGLKDS
jgi:type IV pilus assembly protein PilM